VAIHEPIRLDEENESKEKSFEAKVEELLLKKRRIFFSSAVTDETAKKAIYKLWYLEYKDPGKPILFVINSPGGAVDSGFAIWDQMHMISSPIVTLVTGLAASMGSLLSLAAAPKQRFATPNARIMIHQPLISGFVQGQATDLDIHAQEILKTHETIVQTYAEATGKDPELIKKTIDRDTWMSAKEAKDFGLLDGVVTTYQEIGFS